MPLYFAYGSNMNLAAMRARCPDARRCGRAELNGYQFYIMREGYASIVRDPKASVFGLLWQVSAADIMALDHYEEVASGLYGKRNAPVLVSGGVRHAFLYFGRSPMPGVPRPGYMEAVLSAAAGAALPLAYLRFLEGFLPTGRTDGRLCRQAPRFACASRSRPEDQQRPLRPRRDRLARARRALMRVDEGEIDADDGGDAVANSTQYLRACRGQGRELRSVQGTRRVVRVRIRGAVQGVGYRAWTFTRARQLHLAGYVRNCANGDVEALFAGAAASVSAMLDACWQGPPMAEVAAVEVEEIGRAAAAEYASLQEFAIRPTY